MYPPRNEQNATTDSHVPFITLQRRSLPWERDLLLDGESILDYRTYAQMTDVARKYPWMALLIFKEDELMNGDQLGVFKGDEGLCLVNSKNGIPGIFAHWNQSKRDAFGIDSSMDEMTVDAIRVSDFNPVPSANARRSTSSCACSSSEPQDKEQCGSDEDGWFSVVLGNRVLKPDQKYHACLVSLEGRLSEDILPTNPPIVRKFTRTTANKAAAMLMANVGLPPIKSNEKASKEVKVVEASLQSIRRMSTQISYFSITGHSIVHRQMEISNQGWRISRFVLNPLLEAASTMETLFQSTMLMRQRIQLNLFVGYGLSTWFDSEQLLVDDDARLGWIK